MRTRYAKGRSLFGFTGIDESAMKLKTFEFMNSFTGEKTFIDNNN
jgi:hypothetical protein